MESIQGVGGGCRTGFIRGNFDCVRGTSADGGFVGIDFGYGSGCCADEHEFCAFEGGDGVRVLETVAL